MTLHNSKSRPVAAESASNSAASQTPAAQPQPASPFTDFTGLVLHLPMYGERMLRELIKRQIIPSIRPPKSRKLGFHLPSVDAAILRYQKGGVQ